MKLNKWDYRYPFFGIQKLHNYRYGYGYGLPIFPKVNVDSNFLSIVNRLEDEMKDLQGLITEETLDDLRHLLEQFNDVDSVLNVDDVQAIVDYAIGSLEFPDVLTLDEVKQEITDAINTIDVGLTVMEVQMLVGEMLDELELGLNQIQVETLIHEAIAMIDTGLKQPQVEFLINKALMDIDKGLSEEEIIQLIEFHSQTIPLDSIINDIDNLRRDFEMIEIPDVDLTPIMVRIEELKNSMNDDYDDTHIINMINDIRNDIDNIDNEDVDLTEIYNYLNSLEEDVSRIEYDDSWIHTELDKLRNTIANIEIEGVDLTLVYDRLHNLETAVDNDTIYDDTEVRAEIENLRVIVDNFEMYDDTEIRQEIQRIDAKPVYDDTEVRQELERIDAKPVYDDTEVRQSIETNENNIKTVIGERYNYTGTSEEITTTNEFVGLDLVNISPLFSLENQIYTINILDVDVDVDYFYEIADNLEVNVSLDETELTNVRFNHKSMAPEWEGNQLISLYVIFDYYETPDVIDSVSVNIVDTVNNIEFVNLEIPEFTFDRMLNPVFRNIYDMNNNVNKLENLLSGIEMFDYDTVMGRLESVEETTYYWDGAAEDVENWLFENNAQPLRFTGEGVYDPENLLLRADEKWAYIDTNMTSYNNGANSIRNKARSSLIKGESSFYNERNVEIYPYDGHHNYYINSPVFILEYETIGEGDINLTFAINPKFAEYDNVARGYDVIINIENYIDGDGNVFNYKRIITYDDILSGSLQFSFYLPEQYDTLYIHPVVNTGGATTTFRYILPNGRQHHELNAYGLWITERNVSENQ